jgi:hypothetical protein
VQEDAVADQDHNSRGVNDQWRFTPSLMDPNSMAFTSFANQLPAYYAPTPGAAANTIYQSQAGDLHTPHMAMNIVNPLSISSAGGLATDATVDMSQLQHPLGAHQFQNLDPFAQPPSFAPSTFINHDSIYEHMDASMDGMNGHVNPSLGLVAPGNVLGDQMDTQQIPGNDKYV